MYVSESLDHCARARHIESTLRRELLIEYVLEQPRVTRNDARLVAMS